MHACSLVLLSLACVHELRAAEEHDEAQAEEARGELRAMAARVERLQAAVDVVELQLVLSAAATPEPQPQPEPPPPPPPSAEEIASLLAEAEAKLRELDLDVHPRTSLRGRAPEGSGLAQAYEQARAFGLEGRFEQVRQWTALAKFGSREPGARPGRGPLARYDLIVIPDPKKSKRATVHVVVPAAGLAPPKQRGTHEAWVEGERWINLADRLEPGRDYLPFKTNGKESVHRQWGKAEVIASLVDIATDYRQRAGVPLGVGDISEVTGGKIQDHWTHKKGVDADLYLIDPAQRDEEGRPVVWWHHQGRSASVWAREPKGKGEREPRLDPEDELSLTATSQRLELLAQIVFPIDEIGYFVHDDPTVLDPFDRQVGSRRPGRRFLHAHNRGYWPRHCDHVHLRWVEGKLPPADATPRP